MKLRKDIRAENKPAGNKIERNITWSNGVMPMFSDTKAIAKLHPIVPALSLYLDFVWWFDAY